jgi:integration host factor subunit beta
MGRTITKKELVSRIADRTGQTKVVTKEVIQLFLDEIISELGRGNRLEFREFGVFEIKERAARKAQNPRTLEKVYVPAKKVVKFKVGRLMKERVAEVAAEEERRLGSVSNAGATDSSPPGSPPPPPAPPTGYGQP